MYTATEKRPDFKLIRKRFLLKRVCLRGSAPDPAGGLTAPPDPSWKRFCYTPIRPICVNRPAFGGTVPHFHQMSRGPAKSADVPHFSKMVLLFFSLPIRPYSTCCLATQQSGELRIKIGKDRNSEFARRQATDYKYTVGLL